MTGHSEGNGALASLALPDGGFAMVALDQRESMRDMLAAAGKPADDDALREFKREGMAALSPYASAVLVDRAYGLPTASDAARPAPRLAPNCALILAADALDQVNGQPVADTDVDPEITPELVGRVGAAALKLLVIWRAERGADHRADIVGRFLTLCREAGVPSIVEGVVRGDWADDSERSNAIVAAAKELGAMGPALYKGEVPTHAGGDSAVVEQRCAEITGVLDCPWVVLSSGVPPDEFPAAVAAACRGGASGFLAGRAIWTAALRADRPTDALRTDAAVRLQHLVRLVRDERR